MKELYQRQVARRTSSFSFFTYPCGPFTIGQGADGFSFFTPNLAGVREFAAPVLLDPRLRLIDDFWISAFLHLRGIAVESLQAFIPGGGPVYDVTHDLNQLRHLQGDLGRVAAMTQGFRWLLGTLT